MHQNIPILRIGEILLTSISTELDDSSVDRLQENLLSSLEQENIGGIILEVSSLDSIDSYVAQKIVETGMMAKLMGVEVAVTGIRPEVSATLTRMGFKFRNVHTALSLEEGLALIHRLIKEKNSHQGKTYGEPQSRFTD